MKFSNARLIKFSALVIAMLAMTLFVAKPNSSASAKDGRASVRTGTAAIGAPVVCATCSFCFPTCSTTDIRFLSLSGTGVDGFVGGTIEVGLQSSAANIIIGVFDANKAGLWDTSGGDATKGKLQFQLLADPLGNGSGSGGTIDTFGSDDAGASGENAWFDQSYPNSALAQNGGVGPFRYVLRISMPAPGTNDINAFKLRTDGLLTLTGQTLQFIAKANTLAEANILYQGGPLPTATTGCGAPSTYDGSWEIPFVVAAGTTKIEMFDGDFDFGSDYLADRDTDDPNSTGIPAFAVGTGANPEGIAGAAGVGSPADDNTNCGFRRSPSVIYKLIGPGGVTYTNSNPSGDREWERFLVSTDPADTAPAISDFNPASLPAGLWKLRIEGMDVFNQFSLRLNFTVIAITGEASLGDQVFNDTNSNGTFEPGLGETGIANVTVQLKQDADLNGSFETTIGTQTTNANGFYLFAGLLDGNYQVTVTDTNGVLSGYTKTTGPTPGANNNSQVLPYNASIVGQTDNLTADFGYVINRVGGQGCTPGYWKQSQHFDSWTTPPFYPTGPAPGPSNFGAVFFNGVPIPANCHLCSMTLLAVLGNGGGGEDAFGRQAVSALLNSARLGAKYKYSVQDVINLVRAAYADGSFEAKKNIFEGQTDSSRGISCPLN